MTTILCIIIVMLLLRLVVCREKFTEGARGGRRRGGKGRRGGTGAASRSGGVAGVSKAAMAGREIKYGDAVTITNSSGMAISPCGDAPAGVKLCGVGVTLRPDSEFTKWEPDSNLRKWLIFGGEIGAPVKNGDSVQIKATAQRWTGHSGYLSPCGMDCGGAAATLRPRSELGGKPELRQWTIMGDGEINVPLISGKQFSIKANAGHVAAHHGGFLTTAPCNAPSGCGPRVIVKDNTMEKWTITVQ